MRLAFLILALPLLAGCEFNSANRMEQLADEMRRASERMEQVASEITRSANASADLVESVGDVVTLAGAAAANADDAAESARAALEARETAGTIGAAAGGIVAGPAGAEIGREAGQRITDAVIAIVGLAGVIFGKGALDERKKRGQAEKRAAAAEAALAVKAGA